MVQTLQQRKANEKFAKREERRKGKPDSESKKGEQTKSPVSGIWLYLLAFVVLGPLGFEFVRMIWGYF
ncbi:hypothetical protein EDC01DRAFT_670266, partial [Geopyxis carbonaria]